MRAMQQAGADHICLVETNTAWHANDFLYDISMVNKHIWSIPTKTTGASCRTEKHRGSSYQPGGVMSITANSLTTKINTVATDSLGRWTKTNFFAKKGSFLIYTIYRSNPGSLASSGVNSAWMQQYRALSQNNANVDPRQQLIDDLIEDILKEQAMNSTILLAGDFNEDFNDGHETGITKLMSTCGLKNVFKDLKGHMPSTYNNRRSIDHFFISENAISLVSQAGVVPDETSFTSDHAGLFLDISPNILECKNQPIPPPKQRQLKYCNKVNVEKYVTYALEQFEAQNIVKRLQRLHQQIKEDGSDSEAGETLNSIDKKVTEIMLRSEKRLSPEDTPFAYSVELERQMRIVRLITRIKDQKALNYPLETYVNGDLEDVAVELVRMDDDKLETTLKEQREKIQNIARDMKFRKIQKRTFERIEHILTSTNFAQISRLALPKHLFHETTDKIWDYIQSTPDDILKSIDWEYTEDAAEIERRLLEWNIHHFNQAHPSPLASKYWQDKLNPIHKTEAELDDILHYTLLGGEDLSAETICLLEQISQNIQPLMDSKRTTITKEIVRSFYSKTPEDKSASPSGLHIGHYKSAVTNATFSYILWSILSIAYSNSFCLDRWKLSATTLLEKNPRFSKNSQVSHHPYY